MARSINIGPDKFPGLIDPPKDDSISITWLNKKTIQVMLKVKPIDSPSTIIVGIMLDNEE
jgi:hypothetical protein